MKSQERQNQRLREAGKPHTHYCVRFLEHEAYCADPHCTTEIYTERCIACESLDYDDRPTYDSCRYLTGTAKVKTTGRQL